MNKGKVPEAKTAVAFKTYSRNDGFSVYSKLTAEDIIHIPGVTRANGTFGDGVSVAIDPRYSVQEVMDYIEWLANQKPCECSPKQFTIWTWLTCTDLARIPGVVNVESNSGAHRHITVDDCCDLDDMIDYIKWLDEENFSL